MDVAQKQGELNAAIGLIRRQERPDQGVELVDLADPLSLLKTRIPRRPW